jgi:hypothetical protein
MPLPPGASARDRWLDLVDEARAKTLGALANGDHRMAGLWDEEERTRLRSAYEDVPFPDDASADDGAADTSLDAGDSSPEGDVHTASADDPATVGEFLMAANTNKKPANTAKTAPPVPLPAPARSAEDRAKVIFGETSGLYPQSIDPAGKENDPQNWAAGSFDNLQAARRYMGIVASRNRRTERNVPNPEKEKEVEVWGNAMSAGTAAQNNPDLLDSRITQFFIRGDKNRTKEAFSNQKPRPYKYLTIGPFRSVGGGDAGGGNDTYIEFYGKR